MSLAAVPVFLLARRLGLSARVALALAAFTVLVPDLLYASFISSEALAYPLVLASVYAADARARQRRPGAHSSLFVALAGPGDARPRPVRRAADRVRPGAVVVGARERRTREALREQLLPLVRLRAWPPWPCSRPGRRARVGVYRWLFGFHAGPLGIVHWAALDAMTLAYAAGWIIVPGALLGLWLALPAPRSTEELAFGVVAVLLVAALFFEAGFLQASLDRRQGDPGALRLLRGSSARALLRPLRARGAGRCASPTWRSPPRSCSSRCACR